MRSNQAWMLLTASVVSVVSCRPSVLDEEWRLAVGPGVDLYQVKLVLVADEVDVVVVGTVSDRQALDDQPRYQAAQLVE